MTLHPEALVIRGGTVRDVKTLKTKIEEAIEDGDGAVISVFCDVRHTDNNDNGMGLEELCRVSNVVHTKVQLSTVSRLRAEGFSPELDVSDGQPFTHHHVTIEEPVQESRLETFIKCFDEPIANPTGGKRQS